MVISHVVVVKAVREVDLDNIQNVILVVIVSYQAVRVDEDLLKEVGTL
jgi:hypothetical protein